MNECVVEVPISKESAEARSYVICNILVKIYAARVEYFTEFLNNQKTSLKVSKILKQNCSIARKDYVVDHHLVEDEKENQLISKGCSTFFRWLEKSSYYNVSDDRFCLGCG